MNILNQYPSWFYLGCLILGVLFALALYRKDSKLNEFAKPVLFFLTGLRFVSVSIISLLLLSPLIQYQTNTVQEPILVFAIDNSSSMRMGSDSSFLQSELETQLSALQEELNGEYQVENYLFDQGAVKTANYADFSGKITSYKPLWDELKVRYTNRNLGAVVILSDGIYNRGENPNYLNRLPAPLFVVPFGDTLDRKDAKIKRISNNEIAFLGNEFPVELELQFSSLKTEQAKIEIRKGSELVFTEELRIASEKESIQVQTQIEAKELGLSRYTAKILPMNGESLLENNQLDFYVDVLDGRQRILMLAEGPHPDLRALKAAMESKANYQVELGLLDSWDGEIGDFDLIVFYQLPIRNDMKSFAFFEQMKAKGISALFVHGPASDFPRLNSWNTGIEVDATAKNGLLVRPRVNKQFPLFQISEEHQNRINRFTYASAPVAEYTAKQQSFSLLKQTLGLVETEFPLLSFSQESAYKQGHFFASNFWKWRMAEYVEYGDHQAFDDLIVKSVQFLAIKADKSYFRLSQEGSYFENQEIHLNAQLYNESYELVNSPELELELRDDKDQTYRFAFNRTSDAYSIRIPGLAIGEYRFEAKTELGGKTYVEKGEFSIKKIQLEGNELLANHNMLYQLAQRHGGQLIPKEELTSLKQLLEEREDVVSIVYQEEELEDLINLKWIFYILLISLSLEWFLRKRQGAY